ncbi:hypothetical protein ACIB24_09005 [Spongisporangium articulatum]|uniref:Uncharacterized protein n=1 Tax=Spongisporangium articulatum TaxID=3362603 RepID=A0ABW8AMK8_9ACTN
MSEQPLERSQQAIDEAKAAAEALPNLPDDDPDVRQEPMTSPGSTPEPDKDEDLDGE